MQCMHAMHGMQAMHGMHAMHAMHTMHAMQAMHEMQSEDSWFAVSLVLITKLVLTQFNLEKFR